MDMVASDRQYPRRIRTLDLTAAVVALGALAITGDKKQGPPTVDEHDRLKRLAADADKAEDKARELQERSQHGKPALRGFLRKLATRRATKALQLKNRQDDLERRLELRTQAEAAF